MPRWGPGQTYPGQVVLYQPQNEVERESAVGPISPCNRQKFLSWGFYICRRGLDVDLHIGAFLLSGAESESEAAFEWMGRGIQATLLRPGTDRATTNFLPIRHRSGTPSVGPQGTNQTPTGFNMGLLFPNGHAIKMFTYNLNSSKMLRLLFCWKELLGLKDTTNLKWIKKWIYKVK